MKQEDPVEQSKGIALMMPPLGGHPRSVERLTSRRIMGEQSTRRYTTEELSVLGARAGGAGTGSGGGTPEVFTRSPLLGVGFHAPPDNRDADRPVKR